MKRTALLLLILMPMGFSVGYADGTLVSGQLEYSRTQAMIRFFEKYCVPVANGSQPAELENFVTHVQAKGHEIQYDPQTLLVVEALRRERPDKMRRKSELASSCSVSDMFFSLETGHGTLLEQSFAEIVEREFDVEERLEHPDYGFDVYRVWVGMRHEMSEEVVVQLIVNENEEGEQGGGTSLLVATYHLNHS